MYMIWNVFFIISVPKVGGYNKMQSNKLWKTDTSDEQHFQKFVEAP